MNIEETRKLKKIQKSAYIWNMAGSMFMAFQSVIMLVIVSNTIDIYTSGILTIAYANANLFVFIGKYGVRNFQVSDVDEHYKFVEYIRSRFITSAAMLVVTMLYLCYAAISREYSYEKSLIILLMCVFKSIDAIEDVYHGRMQQKGRLDIAAKLLTFRMITSIGLFGGIVIVSHKLLISLLITTIFSALFSTISIRIVLNYSNEINDIDNKADRKKILDILKKCFPLFLATFLSMYIGNAPKYAIDATMSDEIQAIYGYIAMPVFVIGLLNSFIFNPILGSVSMEWHEGNISKFKKRVIKQVCVIICITIVCVIGAYFIGVPVLSLMYNVNLNDYKEELLVLLAGGGLLGLTGFFSTVITIMRYQKLFLYIYIVVSVLAFVLSTPVVRHFGMKGAIALYLFLMLLLCVCLLVVLLKGLEKCKRDYVWGKKSDD